MQVGISFISCSLIYCIILAIVYFKKDRIKTPETKIYGILLSLNIIGLILELLCCYTVVNYQIMPLINEIINRLYLIYFVIFVTVFTIYVYFISFNDNKKRINKILTKFSPIRLIIIAFLLICLISVTFLPIKYYYDSNIVYSYGIATQYLYYLCLFYMIIDFYCLIKNYKNIKSKKNIPLFTLIVCFIIAFIIRTLNPGIILITSSFALVTAIMYFTIENPDVKMINELELAKNQAEKANRAKSDFISSMSHEIRTPLNAICGFSEFIQTEQDPKEREEDAKNILMASQNLLEIVNGVLDISKIEAEKMEVIETEYELMPILENLSDLMIPRIGDKEIELKTDFAPDIPKTLYGDKTKVKQIITNLLTNAVKYTDEGIINFKVNCINQKGVSTLRIVVSDTGRGIKKEQMDKLFTKFQRLDEDKNTTIEGTGLGLAITKSLVEMMGGNINVQSVYGSGSTFTINLSQKIVDKTINNTEEEINKVIDFSGKKILVVDDNNLNLLVANKMLKEYKVKTDLVTSGFDCINRIEDNEHYDLILMDDMMPKMSGKDTFKKLKENKDFNTPIVILTANAIKGMKENYLNIGFNDYLSKPIDKDELEKVLNKYLGSNTIQPELLKESIEEESNMVEPIEEEKSKTEDLSIKKVLIVDDNKLNIKVAENVLKEYNFSIDSCLSGKECIDKIKNNEHYDLIFMDDMMPELSGPETLKELKSISNFNIPIVSLTANKEQSNTREYYLNLGFDEYIGKPIDKEILNDVINKLLKINKPIEEQKKEEKIETNNNEVQQITDEDIIRINKLLAEKEAKQNLNNEKGNVDYLKESGIDVDASLELLGDIDMYNETLNMFVDENKTRIPRIEENKKIGNMKDYAIDVHALKSDSKYLGFKKLAELSYDHELKSKANDSNYITEHYNELMEEYNRIDNIIKKYM